MPNLVGVDIVGGSHLIEANNEAAAVFPFMTIPVLAHAPPSCYTDSMRRFLCLSLMVLMFPLSAIQAQNDGGRAAGPSGIFPLALVLEAAEFSAAEAGIWRPDWPVQLPPDAFRVLAGAVSGITLEGEGVLLTFRYDHEENRLEEFPFMLNGRMAQVSLGFRDGAIREMTVSFPPDEGAWELEFLEYRYGNPGGLGLWFPVLARGYFAGSWYFVSLSRWARGITETWFDQEGNVLGGYAFSLTEYGEGQRIRSVRPLLAPDAPEIRLYYDSWGLVTRIAGPGGAYTALHHRDVFVRYWERGDGAFYLQWDANGVLVRMTHTDAEEPDLEYRFEYTFDERGNWVERREIVMIRRGGFWFPSPGTIFKRSLEYRNH